MKIVISKTYKNGQKYLTKLLMHILKAINLECEFPKVEYINKSDNNSINLHEFANSKENVANVDTVYILKVLIAKSFYERKYYLNKIMCQILRAMNYECEFPKIQMMSRLMSDDNHPYKSNYVSGNQSNQIGWHNYRGRGRGRGRESQYSRAHLGKAIKLV